MCCSHLTNIKEVQFFYLRRIKEVHMECVDDAYTPPPPAQYEQPTDGPWVCGLQPTDGFWLPSWLLHRGCYSCALCQTASMLVLVPPRCSIQQRRSKWPIWDYDAKVAWDLWTTLGTAPQPYWSATLSSKGWIIIGGEFKGWIIIGG
jgi:hypothetical protein